MIQGQCPSYFRVLAACYDQRISGQQENSAYILKVTACTKETLSHLGSFGDFRNTYGPLQIEAICVSNMSVTHSTSTRLHNLKTRTTCLRLSFLKVVTLVTEFYKYMNFIKVNKNLSTIILEDCLIFRQCAIFQELLP
jgi:hypothetical protein